MRRSPCLPLSCSLVLLGSLVLCVGGCTREPPKPPPAAEPEVPPRPVVNEAFVRSSLDPQGALANEGLVLDLDPAPGEEAMVAARIGGGLRYLVALVRGNHQVLARSPLGGKVLAHANVRSVGQFRALDLPGVSPRAVTLPVVTLVNKLWVCGVLVYRYRTEALVLVGELACRCWSKESGAAEDEDPYSMLATEREGDELKLELKEDQGSRVYRWDLEQGTFIPILKKK